jgi:hypothetical protein
MPRKRKYEEAKKILGKRNRYAKTDKDATFMKMKEDPREGLINYGETVLRVF